MNATRIYLDLDDVLAETTRQFPALVKQLFGRERRFEDLTNFDLDVAFGLEPEQLRTLFEHCHEDEWLLALPTRVGVSAVLEAWDVAEAEIHVVTGRPPSTENASRRWLERHGLPHAEYHAVDKYGRFPELPDILQLEDIANFGYDLAVEDSLPTAAWLVESGVDNVLLLDRPWNRDVSLLDSDTLAGIRRVQDWQEIELIAFPDREE